MRKGFLVSRFRMARYGLLLLVVLVSAFPAAAQFQAGDLHGRVTDQSGAALPGVTVTLTGMGAPRTFVSDEQGNFRFLNLEPGQYQLRAELAGFGTATRPNLSINIGRSTAVDITMRPTLEESVTVTAEAPLLDVRRTGTGATVPATELQEVPTARDPWVILQQVPGVTVDRINVGGNESGQQSVYVGKGASFSQSTWNVDGVNITDMAATGFSPGYFDFDSLEEMQVTTGGSDPRIKTAGVNLNLVTKRGTNDLRGSARYLVTDNDWQAATTIPDEAQSYLRQVNEINHIEDFGLEAGGPILRDRLWFWGAYAEQNVENLAAAGLPALYHDDTFLTNLNLKLNAQILPSNSATAVYTESAKEKFGRDVGPTRPPETAFNQGHIDEGPLVGGFPFFKIEDTHIFGSSFYVTGLYSETEHTFFLTPVGGLDKELWRGPVPGQTTNIFTWHNTFFDYGSERPATTYRADASAFVNTGAVSHELRFGFGYRETPVTSYSVVPSSGNWGWIFNAATNFGLAYITREQVARYGADSTDLYVGDTMMFGNLTLQAGFRYDMQTASNFASTVRANPVFPEILPQVQFRGDEEELEWNTISPRIGATWAIGTNRTTLLRGAYNRYADQLGAGTVAAANPFPYTQGISYYWTDANGDRVVQRPEVDFSSGPYFFYAVDPNNPGAPFSTVRIDYDMDVPTTDEFIVGFERELLPQFTVGANYSHRIMNNFVARVFEKTRGRGDFYTAADWEVAGNVTGNLPNGGGAYSIPYYKLRSGVRVPTYSVLTNREGYSRSFNGVELFATKRLSNRWMLRGNFSWNDWKQHVDVPWSTNGDPTRLQTGYGCSVCDDSTVAEQSGGSGNKGGVFLNARWSYVLTGMVELPFALNLGASITGREGYPLPYTHRVNAGEGPKAVLVTEDVGDVRMDDIMNVDLRLSREFRFMNRAGVTLSIDAFNITDERTVIQRDRQLYSARTTPSTSANRILEMQSPRVFRVGARVTF